MQYGSLTESSLGHRTHHLFQEKDGYEYQQNNLVPWNRAPDTKRQYVEIRLMTMNERYDIIGIVLNAKVGIFGVLTL